MLVTQLRQGDKPAFSALFSKYSERVYFTALKFHLSHADAEEIVQEVFIKIWEKREQIDPARSFNAFIASIAKNMIINNARKKAHEMAHQHYLLGQQDIHRNSTEEEVISTELTQYAQSCIDKLPPQQKQIFELSRLKGLSHEEIAEQLNLSKRTVENHHFRAMKYLKTHMHPLLSLSKVLLLSLFI
ncbi:RNA polymerase sigma-70 factor [Rapidithrix thailandica]|uniref:RNA polymerase sigma factor n=1 Tax=Rapidithrix thailandica TaxID=413964 RepID=A0AAW9S471_9BACT